MLEKSEFVVRDFADAHKRANRVLRELSVNLTDSSIKKRWNHGFNLHKRKPHLSALPDERSDFVVDRLAVVGRDGKRRVDHIENPDYDFVVLIHFKKVSSRLPISSHQCKRNLDKEMRCGPFLRHVLIHRRRARRRTSSQPGPSSVG